VIETEHFVKERFGWVCRRCSDAARRGEAAADIEDTGRRAPLDVGRARFFHEGEAEEREPTLFAPGLARRRDVGGRRVLYCPSCGAEEAAESSEGAAGVNEPRSGGSQ